MKCQGLVWVQGEVYWCDQDLDQDGRCPDRENHIAI